MRPKAHIMPGMPIPDLLSHSPVVRLDAAALKQTLTFGFASGVPSTALAQHLESALPSSSWEPGSFAKELFLSELIAGCCKVTIETRAYAIDRANLARILARPPRDQGDFEMRRGVLRDLASSETLRRDFERIYVSLHQFRSLLEAPPIARRAAGNRRRLDILTGIKSAIDAMSESFDRERLRARDGSDSSAPRCEQPTLIGGCATFSTTTRTSPRSMFGFASASTAGCAVWRCSRSKKTRATGSMRHRSVDSSTKLGGLFRGYRFSEQELLARLIDGVYEGLENEIVQMFQLIGDMEFYLAALAFRDFAKKAGLEVCLPELVPPAACVRRASGANHPRSVQSLAPRARNSRGPLRHRDRSARHDAHRHRPQLGRQNEAPPSRSRSPRCSGNAGFFAPAREAQLAVAPGLFVSLIEEATADQSEGRLGMELIRIRSLFEKLRVGSMVVLDELCSGTNPSEGEEIFELVVTLLAELRPQAFITTHFLQMASRIAQKPPVPGLMFLQVELDKHQFPTYRFVPGVADTSLAHRTAARLGVTREELLALVEASKRVG